jgi:hypothetical protein
LATGWTECVPIVVRDGALAIEALGRARELFSFPLIGVDFDNDIVFMNEPVIGWCRDQGLEVTRSRAYRKNDQAWVEQKNGAIVRRLVGYGRLEGLLGAGVLARLYAAGRLHGNLFQPSFKPRHKNRIGARVIKRYHAPEPPVAGRSRTRRSTKRARCGCGSCSRPAIRSCCWPAQAELGDRIDRRGTVAV